MNEKKIISTNKVSQNKVTGFLETDEKELSNIQCGGFLTFKYLYFYFKNGMHINRIYNTLVFRFLFVLQRIK